MKGPGPHPPPTHKQLLGQPTRPPPISNRLLIDGGFVIGNHFLIVGFVGVLCPCLRVGRLPVFGDKALKEFLSKHNFDFIIRAHEIKADGIQTRPRHTPEHFLFVSKAKAMPLFPRFKFFSK